MDNIVKFSWETLEAPVRYEVEKVLALVLNCFPCAYIRICAKVLVVGYALLMSCRSASEVAFASTLAHFGKAALDAFEVREFVQIFG